MTNPLDYDRIIVAFSGGKDSVACLMHLLELGCHEKIELWHHDIDGKSEGFMDWPCTPAYCKAFACEYNLPIYFSWLEGGFKREMLRDNDPKAPTHFETPHGHEQRGGTGSLGKRLKFPQVGADLKTRWCSAYLKIDVSRIALNNQTRFNNSKTLFVQGERAEESPNRAKYNTFEPHPCDRRDSKKLKRHIDVWRPVHGWSTEQVWACLQEHKIRPHPAYCLGWGRLSCMTCIFGSADQWASVRAIAPKRFNQIATFEQDFEHTIHRKHSIEALADMGTPYKAIALNPDIVAIAMGESYPLRIFDANWEMPIGSTGDLIGPQ